MPTFVVCTHVGDDKRIQVNLDGVQTIEPHQRGALIKFSMGTNAALHVQETPEQVAQAANLKSELQGPLKINLETGKWVDLETGRGGRDVVTLAAYLQTLSEFDAALRLAGILGLSLDDAMAQQPTLTSTAA